MRGDTIVACVLVLVVEVAARRAALEDAVSSLAPMDVLTKIPNNVSSIISELGVTEDEIR